MGEFLPILFIIIFFGAFVGLIVWSMKKSGKSGANPFLSDSKPDDKQAKK